ncbi:MAG: glycoside hydrolase family 3 N-terminal domain-containing protein [Alphaproteobacteria bacterium]
MELAEKISHLLIVGFHGVHEEDEGVQRMAKQISAGTAGGVILFGYNIESPTQVKKLTGFLKKHACGQPLLMAVDQEGGRVERLSPQKGFKGFKTPKAVSHLSAEDALKHYTEMASELAEHGFNLDFAPCVDMDPLHYTCPVIGGLDRSFGHETRQIVKYGKIVMEALKDKHILNCIKHFPGHGSALGDTHEGYVDVSEQWEEKELRPFMELVHSQGVDMVMTAHIFNKHLDAKNPATFSKGTLSLLREGGYQGIIISDDLHMSAIQKHYSFEESIVKAFAAGNDMVIFSNSPAAAKGIETFKPDPLLPEKFIQVVQRAVHSNLLKEESISASFERVMTLKKNIKN